MKVKQLIASLQKADPEAEVVTSGSDHSYNVVRSVVPMTAGKTTDRDFYEWYGSEHASEGEKPVPVVYIE